MRRLPHTLTALEAAARKVAHEAPRQERQWYQMPVFWLGLAAGGLIVLVFGPRPIERSPPQPMAEPARIEAPAAALVRPTQDTPMPAVVDAEAEPVSGEAPETQTDKAAPAL